MNRRSVKYYKLTPDEQALLKKVWSGVENNPQLHGTSFFVEFCKLHPQYTKYFTSTPQVPLNFDGPNVAKFTVIMETIGYLVLDYHRKPKQLDQLVGYIAMVHKDMGLRHEDMLNFGTCLIQYLCKKFSLPMDDPSVDVFTKYFTSILGEMAFKMEEFLKDDRLNALDDDEDDMKGADTMFSAAMTTTSKNPNILVAEQKGNRRETIRISQKRGPTKRMLCGHWSSCRKNLIYGQSLHYWKDRKREWDSRLKYWDDLSTTNYSNLKMQTSTSDEEETYKSKTEDETASEMAGVSLPEMLKVTVAENQVTPLKFVHVLATKAENDTYETTDELKELLVEQKVVPAESINVSQLINDKLTRGSEVIKLKSVPEDANEILEEILTPRERRRTRSFLGKNVRNGNTFPSLEFQDVKKKVPVESQELKDPQENKKISPPAPRMSVESARQRRRESRKQSLP